MVVLINQKSAEYFKTLIIYKNGKPVASGCINITQAPINLKQEDDEDYDNKIEGPINIKD